MSPLMMRIFDSCASRSPVRRRIGEPAWPGCGERVGVRKLTNPPLPGSVSTTTRYDCNARGQLTNQWGGGTYPVAYTYDTEGRMTTLSTYRAGSFTAATWAAAADAATIAGQTPDITTWTKWTAASWPASSPAWAAMPLIPVRK